MISGIIKIALIEDDDNLRHLLSQRLQAEGYNVVECSDGSHAEELIIKENPEVVLLDWMLPGKDGIKICQSLRQNGFHNMIVMLTVKNQVVDRIEAYQAEISGYLTKPFNMDLVIALISSKIKYLVKSKNNNSIKYGNIEYLPDTHTLIRDDKKIELTVLENRILYCLLKNIGKIVSREEIMIGVWGYNTDVNTRTLDMHVVRLRKKLGDNPENPTFLRTIRGIGYQFTT